jgi:hypothetical protein
MKADFAEWVRNRTLPEPDPPTERTPTHASPHQGNRTRPGHPVRGRGRGARTQLLELTRWLSGVAYRAVSGDRPPTVSSWRWPAPSSTEAPVTAEEHDRQRDRALAANLISDDRTERHATYARRPVVLRPTGGFRAGQVTPPRPTEPQR